MTSFGILMPAIRPPKTVDPGDERTLQVRARRARDLDILRARHMRGSLGETLHTSEKDYEYRAYCTPAAFAVALMQISMEIDYLKFKPTVLSGYQDRQLHGCYNRIWSVIMAELSTDEHKGEYWGQFASERFQRPARSSGYRDADWDDASMDAVLGLPSGRQGGTYRDTRADRDAYEPEVADAGVLDGQVVADAPWNSAQHSVYLDGLYVELDDLTAHQREDRAMDHSGCQHAASDNARARCRRRARRDLDARIAELGRLIDDAECEALIHYRDAATDPSPDAQGTPCLAVSGAGPA